ncbi:hypothetical protein [Marinomonas transparens]|uniref:Uncharacterized protein n=1 Tax=Marinomonas transparens TaxID=2795388 RepID=A0A934JTV3_9GAMM|nr:hypothetical protein [Marinomonas transparens]MBJ7539864.1 hypothetical protein [Marinomonas transparens]
MSSQLSTLDHLVMGLLLKSDRLSIPTLSKLSESPKARVRNSLFKLMDHGYVVRRAECGALPLYSAVLDCSYFPPVAYVAERGVLSMDDEELAELVARVDRQHS